MKTYETSFSKYELFNDGKMDFFNWVFQEFIHDIGKTFDATNVKFGMNEKEIILKYEDEKLNDDVEFFYEMKYRMLSEASDKLNKEN